MLGRASRASMVGVAVVAVAGIVAAADAPAKRSCGDGRTVVQNRHARVFSQALRVVAYGRRVRARAFFGCLPKTGRPFPIRFAGGDRPVDTPGVGTADTPRLTGRFFLLVVQGSDAETFALSVWDLRKRRNTYFAFIPLQIDPPGAVAVSSRGGLAWVDAHDSFITKVDGAGAGVIGHVDRAPTCVDGDACDADLAIRGEVLSWRQNGIHHRYRLRGGATGTLR